MTKVIGCLSQWRDGNPLLQESVGSLTNTPNSIGYLPANIAISSNEIIQGKMTLIPVR